MNPSKAQATPALPEAPAASLPKTLSVPINSSTKSSAPMASSPLVASPIEGIGNETPPSSQASASDASAAVGIEDEAASPTVLLHNLRVGQMLRIGRYLLGYVGKSEDGTFFLDQVSLDPAIVFYYRRRPFFLKAGETGKMSNGTQVEVRGGSEKGVQLRITTRHPVTTELKPASPQG